MRRRLLWRRAQRRRSRRSFRTTARILVLLGPARRPRHVGASIPRRPPVARLQPILLPRPRHRAATVTITATSVPDSSAFASAAITIGVLVTFTPMFTPPSSINVSATAQIAATVANDPSNAGVDWSCTPTSACGSFNPTHTNTLFPLPTRLRRLCPAEEP